MFRAFRAQRDPFLGYWAAHAVFYGAASALLGLRGLVADSFVAVVAPALALLATPLIWLAVGRLRNRPRSPWLALIPPALWLLAARPLLDLGGLRAVVMAFSTLSMALSLAAAWECRLAHRQRHIASLRDLAWLLLLAALWFAWRIAEALYGAPEPGAALGGLVRLVIGGSIAFLGLAIARDHAAAAEAATLRRGRAEVERLHAGLPAVIFLREIAADRTSRHLYRGGDIQVVTGWPQAALAQLDSWAEFTAPGTPIAMLYDQALRDGQNLARLADAPARRGLDLAAHHAPHPRATPDGTALAVGYIVNIAAERAEAARAALDRTLAAAPVAVFQGRATRMAASTAATSAAGSSA